MVLLNGKFPKHGFFLAQLCLHTLEIGGILGEMLPFLAPQMQEKKVEMVNGCLQWETPQAWFLSCSIVSPYSTTMTKLMFPLLDPQFQEKQWWRCSMWLLAQLMDSFLLSSFSISFSSMYTMLQAILRHL